MTIEKPIEPEIRYHHRALIDFDHCKKGRCINCSLNQMHKCEEALDRKYGKPRFRYSDTKHTQETKHYKQSNG